jgi:hypothetical protein
MLPVLSARCIGLLRRNGPARATADVGQIRSKSGALIRLVSWVRRLNRQGVGGESPPQ